MPVDNTMIYDSGDGEDDNSLFNVAGHSDKSSAQQTIGPSKDKLIW